jgi:hypothetical protein
MDAGDFILNKNGAYTRLNVEGKRFWGKIFPNGLVPVERFTTQKVRLEGTRDPESGFTVDWTALSEKQQQEILEKLCEHTGTPRELVLQSILKAGLSIRRGYTVGCCTSQTGFLSREDYSR